MAASGCRIVVQFGRHGTIGVVGALRIISDHLLRESHEISEVEIFPRTRLTD